MNYITEFIKNTRFSDKVILGDGVASTLFTVKKYFSSEKFELENNFKTAILGKEKDYLLIGKTLKDRFFEEGVSCEAFVFESLPRDFSFLKGLEIVVCLGDADYYGSLAVFAKKQNIKLVCVSTTLIFADGLCGFYSTGPLSFFEGDIYKLIIDIDSYKKLKRKDLADGYAFCCSALLSAYELLLSEDFLSEKSDRSEIEKLLASAYKTLLLITPENVVGVIVVSELYIASVLCKMPETIIYSDAFSTGKVLASVTGLPQNECVFRLIAPLLVVLKGYFYSGAETFGLIPDVNADIEKLAEIFKVDELYIYEKFTLNGFKKITEKKKFSLSDKDLLKKIDEILFRYDGLMKNYDVVYKGRHSRATFSDEDKRLSIKLGGGISRGLLKLLYDDGFLSIL